MNARELCGQLILSGFADLEPPPELMDQLARGERAGVVRFRRNVHHDLLDLARSNDRIARTCELTPLVAVDQEGGNVARLPAPVLRVPAMRRLGTYGDPALAERVGRALGDELAALGFSSPLAPVLDVDSRADNPVIGARSFASDPQVAATMAVAYARGLRAAGAFACGKHFPGHGDTTADSHHELPRVEATRTVLDARELVPFRAAVAAGFEALMSAHVVFASLDVDAPATLSEVVLTRVLREELGFRGVLFSDDLEMKALSPEVEVTAVRAVRAGCDALLVCSQPGLADRAHVALVAEAERDASFRARCEEAAGRVRALREQHPLRPATTRAELDARLGEGCAASRAVAAELAALGGGA